MAGPQKANWNTCTSLEKLDQLAKENLKLDRLHDWQLEGTARLLSGENVLLLIATGSGKSTLFYLYALAQPRDTVLVISPLKLLEENMVLNLERKGLKAVALNADTISASREEGRDVWNECARGEYRVVLCSPEQLISNNMVDLIANGAFQSRVNLVVVDEAHLIPLWGGDGSGHAFRSAFNAIGTLRSRLASGTVFLALSATLMPGKPTRIVKERLGFRQPNFELMRRDCSRANLWLIFRRMQHPYTQGTAHDIDWVIPKTATSSKDIQKTVIYVDNVSLGNTLTMYTRTLLPPALLPKANTTIRHLHATTCSRCKLEALEEFLKPDSELRVIYATEAFGCGIDIGDIANVILFGTPRNLDALLQRIGRAARAILMGYGYIYINASLWDSVAASLGLITRAKAKSNADNENAETADSEDSQSSCCQYIRQVLSAHLQKQCVARCIDKLYENPLEDKPERCMKCSGCVEDQIPDSRVPSKSSVSGVKKKAARTDNQDSSCSDPIPHLELRRLSKQAKTEAEVQISNAARTVWLSVPAHKTAYQLGGLRAFLPASKLSVLSNRLPDLENKQLVRLALGEDWRFWSTHGELFAAKVLEIRESFVSKLEPLRRVVSRRPHTKQSSHGADGLQTGSDEDSGIESEELEASQPINVAPQHTNTGFSSQDVRLGKRRREEGSEDIG